MKKLVVAISLFVSQITMATTRPLDPVEPSPTDQEVKDFYTSRAFLSCASKASEKRSYKLTIAPTSSRNRELHMIDITRMTKLDGFDQPLEELSSDKVVSINKSSANSWIMTAAEGNLSLTRDAHGQLSGIYSFRDDKNILLDCAPKKVVCWSEDDKHLPSFFAVIHLGEKGSYMDLTTTALPKGFSDALTGYTSRRIVGDLEKNPASVKLFDEDKVGDLGITYNAKKQAFVGRLRYVFSDGFDMQKVSDHRLVCKKGI